jgi:hypothetical protein
MLIAEIQELPIEIRRMHISNKGEGKVIPVQAVEALRVAGG